MNHELFYDDGGDGGGRQGHRETTARPKRQPAEVSAGV